VDRHVGIDHNPTGVFSRYSSKSLRRCLESNGPLQCLDLRESTFIEDAVMISAAGLKANATLQTLRLTSISDSVGQALDLAEVMTALTGHPKLTSFQLADCVIHDEACRTLERLFSAPNCKIESLGLTDITWEFANAGMINLLDAVLPNCPRLQSINLARLSCTG
jgi:hypothetical protein